MTEIRLDRSAHSIVVTCSCGYRAAYATSRAAVRDANTHRHVAHPGDAPPPIKKPRGKK